MTVHLDTSALVDVLTGPRRSIDRLRAIVEGGNRIGVSSLVLFEWLRGPRTRAELQAQEAILPGTAAIPFSHAEAALAAGLYAKVPRPRGREIDLAIAACALTQAAALWTLNESDFRDIPGLRLIDR